jgi:hypothetical protein
LLETQRQLGGWPTFSDIQLVAPSNSRVAIRAISFGQYSDAGDAQAEMLSVLLMRGHTKSRRCVDRWKPSACVGGSDITYARQQVLQAQPMRRLQPGSFTAPAARSL